MLTKSSGAKWMLMGAVFGVVLAGALSALAASMAPTPPIGNSPYGDSFISVSPQTTTLTLNASACTSPGGAACTIILPSTDVAGWPNVTTYVKNTGANALTDVLIETSPNGTDWEEQVANTFDGLAAGAIKSANYIGHYKYLRVEARSASGSSASVWLSAHRP